jgi:uncharacterized protein (DUF1800 family)
MPQQMMLRPEEAWKPFEPAAKNWNRATIAHFYRRAGFGATSAELTAGLEMKPTELAKKLVHESEDEAQQTKEFETLSRSAIPTNNADTLSAAWLYRLLKTKNALQEKMTLFWHGHFATSNEKVQSTKLMHQQNRMLRQHALGDFKQLAHGIAKDPAMLLYLDSESNRKAHPNENFAREIMELFVLGEGNYTEQDVRELARCFTGWELRRERFRFNRYQYDRGEKSVLGESGKLTGEQGIDIVLKQDAGPKFIVRKLLKYFVCDEPELPDAYVTPLANQLRNDDWNVSGVVETMLSSRMFYSPTAFARKIRSPVEMAISLVRSLEGTCKITELGTKLRRLGQGLYHPPNVKGWDGGRTWVNSSTLLGRANLVRALMADDKTKFDGSTLENLLSKRKAGSNEQAVRWLEGLLLALPLRGAVRGELVDILKSAEGSPDARLRKVVHAMSVQPEFQLS